MHPHMNSLTHTHTHTYDVSVILMPGYSGVPQFKVIKAHDSADSGGRRRIILKTIHLLPPS